ncbi:hypothetical protein PIB30_005902 [Stylosanthes scabra]|uniref:Uncharacterized protein n=1 Tax=Stylosanthes scabra TaxID=79078 RepID=A0ABU6R3S0_9FABA|nr:hypothetical protein [Stylosanthes scabra]
MDVFKRDEGNHRPYCRQRQADSLKSREADWTKTKADGMKTVADELAKNGHFFLRRNIYSDEGPKREIATTLFRRCKETDDLGYGGFHGFCGGDSRVTTEIRTMAMELVTAATMVLTLLWVEMLAECDGGQHGRCPTVRQVVVSL